MSDLAKPLQGINIIGVDPSLSNSGLVFIQGGAVTHHANIKTDTKQEYSERIANISVAARAFCHSLVEGLEDAHVDVIAIETPYIGGFKGNSSLKVAEARGALIGGIASFFKNCRPSIVDITPMEAKKAVGIEKRLKRDESKKAVKNFVVDMFPDMDGQSQDILDAISVAIAGAKKYKTEKALNHFIT